MISTTLNISTKWLLRICDGQLGRNIGWLTGAEIVVRLGRIITAIVLARHLDATVFGIAAIAITIFELVRVFTENGIGAAVIRANKRDFDKVANTAHTLMWIICTGLFLIQLFIGALVEIMLPGNDAGLMVASLALVFLIMPFGLLHAYCLQRAERMKHLAVVTSTQAIADHILTAALALAGFGAWAIVLPKVLTAPIWLFGVRYSKPWTREASAGRAPTKTILAFSLPVLGSELLSVCRDQLDKVIVSLTLGIDALGLYYFAFNAGLGVSTSLNRAFSNAVYPHLCAEADKLAAYRSAMLRIGTPITLAYIAQAAAALLYVPIIFGADWATAAPLVALICLGGPARLLVDGARMKARAHGHSGSEFLISLGFCLCVLLPFAVFAPQGLFSAATASIVGGSLYGGALTLKQFSGTSSFWTTKRQVAS
ncbi:MAG: oligosaccharide flippase family protein [Pseudomonadota bacterium]